jgi:hypothetical protein
MVVFTDAVDGWIINANNSHTSQLQSLPDRAGPMWADTFNTIIHTDDETLMHGALGVNVNKCMSLTVTIDW